MELGLGEETIEVSSATDEIGRSLGVALGKTDVLSESNHI